MSSFVHNIPWSEEEITILTPKIFETNLGFESLNREQVSNSGGVLLLTFPQKLAGPYLPVPQNSGGVCLATPAYFKIQGTS